MNIESINTASQPTRTPSAEILPQTQRPSATPAKSIESGAPKSIKDESNARAQTELAVEDAVQRLNDFVAPTRSEINFSIDDASGVRVIKIMDSQSKEVIRQIPSEEAINLARALDKLQGLLIKDKA